MQTKRFSISNYFLSIPKWKKMLFLFILIFMLCIPHAAAFTKKMCENMYETIIEGPVSMILTYLSPFEPGSDEPKSDSLVYLILGKKKTKTGIGLSTWDFSEQMPIIKSLETLCEAIGYALSFIYAVEGIFRKLEQGRDFKQSVIRTGIIFILSILMIANIKRVIYFLIDLSYFILGLVAKGIEMPEKINDKYKDTILEGNSIVVWCKLVIPWMASWISKFMIGMQCISTIVELGIRTAFAPWAFADIMSEGFRSAGILNMQRYLALFIRIGIMIAIVTFSSQLAAESGKVVEGMNYLILQTTIALSTTQILGRAAEWANQIIGVS